MYPLKIGDFNADGLTLLPVFLSFILPKLLSKQPPTTLCPHPTVTCPPATGVCVCVCVCVAVCVCSAGERGASQQDM